MCYLSLVKIPGKILHDFARTFLQDLIKESQARIMQDSDKFIQDLSRFLPARTKQETCMNFLVRFLQDHIRSVKVFTSKKNEIFFLLCRLCIHDKVEKKRL